MAVSIRNLSVLAYANGFTLWHYNTGNDSLDMVLGDTYFSDASDNLSTGDMIIISGVSGGTIRFIKVDGTEVSTMAQV